MIQPPSSTLYDNTTPTARTRSYFVAVVALLLVGFSALGVWQLERRTWKLALIERVEQRVHAAPIDAPGRDRWPAITAAADEYRHVRAAGTFVPDRATWVQAVTEYGRGYWLMAPLRLPSGDIVLVNRGFVSSRESVAAAGPAVVTGLLRVTEPGGSLLHDNEPERDRWYSRDVAAIARVRGLQRVAPYFIDAEADAANEARPDSRAEPIGGLTVVAFHNDHLLYAITWFVLAALCLAALRKLLRRNYERHK